MKKLILLIMMLVSNFMLTFAQDIYLDIEDHPNNQILCLGNNQTVYVNAQLGCTGFGWIIDGQPIEDVSPIIINPEIGNHTIEYFGCDEFYHFFRVIYKDAPVPSPFTQIVWKRFSTIETLDAEPTIWNYDDYSFQWSTGETGRTIDVSEPGTYSCEISSVCGSVIRTFIVRDNVELYRSSVDLATNLNKVTWQTTPEQAEYISQVKVERDGMVVGTAPYGDGQFLDNIGSENAARNYRLVAITTEGIECPLPSYQLGTLHVDFSPNANDPNKINMAWTPPYIEEGAPLTVTYFQICKYDPNTGEVTVVDQIGANNTIGSYNISLFDGGYATVAAVFSEGKDYEELSFSNMTEDILSVGENVGNQIRIYPNPANGRFTVEGTGIMHISNVLGQEIMTKEIDGKETVELLKGMYFVQLNGTVRKIVVE